jgi:hypothetical protein
MRVLSPPPHLRPHGPDLGIPPVRIAPARHRGGRRPSLLRSKTSQATQPGRRHTVTRMPACFPPYRYVVPGDETTRVPVASTPCDRKNAAACGGECVDARAGACGEPSPVPTGKGEGQKAVWIMVPRPFMAFMDLLDLQI